jgi:hypothetical protein
MRRPKADWLTLTSATDRQSKKDTEYSIHSLFVLIGESDYHSFMIIDTCPNKLIANYSFSIAFCFYHSRLFYQALTVHDVITGATTRLIDVIHGFLQSKNYLLALGPNWHRTQPGFLVS